MLYLLYDITYKVIMKRKFSTFAIIPLALLIFVPFIDCDSCNRTSCEAEYELSEDGQNYYVTESRAYRNKTEVIISSEYEGKPVTCIGDEAFLGCRSLMYITIPDSVTNIEEGAFASCTSLTHITIPDSVTRIGPYAFSQCSSLTSVTLSRNITKIETDTFEYCSALTDISISDGVTVIGSSAFSNCFNLTSITLPHSITKIENDAFNKCRSLASVDLPDSVNEIENYAFAACDSLTSITVADGNATYHSEGNCIIETESKTLTVGCSESVIPADGSVTSLGNCAFYECATLTDLKIPDGVISIGEVAFYNCNALTKITIPDSIRAIGYAAFNGCNKLQYTVFGGGKYLGNPENPHLVIFGVNSNQISSCTVHEDTQIVYPEAFQDCSTTLKRVTLGSKVTYIGAFAFHLCTALTTIVLPDSVSHIADCAFRSCTSLKNVTMGSGIVEIGRFAFNQCPALTEITYQGTKAQWEEVIKNIWWWNNDKDRTIYCTDGNIDVKP